MQKFLVFIVFLSVCQFSHAVDKIKLHLAPSKKSPSILQVKSDDPRLTEDIPTIIDKKNQQIWYEITYTDSLIGYVANRDIGKDLAAIPGAKIHLKPNNKSPLLAIVGKDHFTEVIQAGDWIKLKFEIPITLYFQKRSDIDAVVEIEDKPFIEVDNKKELIPTNPFNKTRYFEGHLKRVGKPLSITSKYKYQIVKSNGRRIAFIDISNLLVSNLSKTYLNKEVIVYGTPVRLKNSDDFLINAITMRLP